MPRRVDSRACRALADVWLLCGSASPSVCRGAAPSRRRSFGARPPLPSPCVRSRRPSAKHRGRVQRNAKRRGRAHPSPRWSATHRRLHRASRTNIGARPSTPCRRARLRSRPATVRAARRRAATVASNAVVCRCAAAPDCRARSPGTGTVRHPATLGAPTVCRDPVTAAVPMASTVGISPAVAVGTMRRARRGLGACGRCPCPPESP